MKDTDDTQKPAAKGHPQRAEFIEAAKAHMAKHGAKNWGILFDRFPDLKDYSKWRYVREAKGDDTPRISDLVDARDKLTASIKKFPTTQRGSKFAKNLDPEVRDEIVDSLPAAPSPAFIARHGDEGLRTIDFVAEITSLYMDAKMLRAYSMRKDLDGNPIEVIGNPATFDKSIGRRAQLLETAIHAVQEVWDLRMMQNFYELIIEEIGRESPDCQQRIMLRLQALNNRHGMTLATMRV